MGRRKRNKRYKGKGWHGESHRHYLASKGIKTSRKKNARRYRAYDPTFVAGDLPLIFGDALGTAGASVASWAWLAGPLAAGAVGLKVGKEVKEMGDEDKMFSASKDKHYLLKERMSREDRGEFIRNRVEEAKIPPDVKSSPAVDQLIEDTEGLAKDDVEDAVNAFIREFRPIEEKLEFELGREPSEKDIQAAELFQEFKPNKVSSTISNLKEDRKIAEEMQNAALNTEVNDNNRRILRDLLRGPKSDENLRSVELWGDNVRPSLDIKGELEFKRTGYGTDRNQIWAVQDSAGNTALWEYKPRSGEIHVNSPGGYEFFEGPDPRFPPEDSDGKI